MPMISIYVDENVFVSLHEKAKKAGTTTAIYCGRVLEAEARQWEGGLKK